MYYTQEEKIDICEKLKYSASSILKYFEAAEDIQSNILVQQFKLEQISESRKLLDTIEEIVKADMKNKN